MTARARGRRRGDLAEGLRGPGRPGPDRAGRRPAPDRPSTRLRGARRGRVPLRLPEPGDAVVRRRPRPDPLGTPLAVPAPEPIRLHDLEAPGRRSSAHASRAGEHIVLRARVAAKMVPATYDVVVATIPGTDPTAGEVVVTAHLCHESAGANDNASGSAAILEVARALNAAALREETLPRPAAHDPLPVAARDHGLAGLPRPASRGRGAPGRRRPHGHGRRPALDDEGHVPPLPHRRVASARRQRDRRGVVRPGRRARRPRYAEGRRRRRTPASSGRRARARCSWATSAA